MGALAYHCSLEGEPSSPTFNIALIVINDQPLYVACANSEMNSNLPLHGSFVPALLMESYPNAFFNVSI